MAEAAKNQGQVAPIFADSSSQAGQSEPLPMWQRQPGESPLWYNRFRIYRNLGYKRSLVAALAKERETAQVLKSPKGAEKKQRGGVKASKGANERQLSEVPKPTQTQVPGSWKIASVKYHWAERVAAYDEYRVDKIVEHSLEDLLDGPALAIHRVCALKSCFELLRVELNANQQRMTFEQTCLYIQRIQSVLKQIADEMATFDESSHRVVFRRMATKIYHEWEPKVAASSLIKKAGRVDQALAAVEAETRQRRQIIP